MDLEQVKQFIELIKGTDIEELYWERDGTKIAFKRGSIVPGEEKVATSKTNGEKTPVSSPGKNKKEEGKVVPVKSPMVGTFYRSLPDRPPLVMENDHVSVGEKVAVIEAMRIIKDVVANVNGRIVKILVENAIPVEYGQDLFLVETEELES